MTWDAIGLKPQLAETLRANGIDSPTPVQAAAIPELLAGRDVSARSQTGSGKTLAYLLPALQRTEPDSPQLQVMVLAPTQELAMQIYKVAETYGEPLGIRIQQLIGGASMQRQVEKLKQHPQVVVGTPGRIHEIMMAGKLKLHHIRFLIVDEADQVFSLGSTREVEKLLKGMVRDRQIAFFSATRPQEMAEVEDGWMREPKRIEIAADAAAGANVDHYFLVCDKREKVDTARRLLRLLNPPQALIFINDTDEIANYEAKFSYEGFAVETLYGDADKQSRAATLARFRDGRCQLLLATDVAARGLDIADLPLVLHLDPAVDADHYVHRSGRTGRMGKPGTVVSIVTPQQLFIMDKFSKQLGIRLQQKVMYRGRLWNPDEVRGGRGGARMLHSGRTARSEGSASELAGSGRTGAVPAGDGTNGRFKASNDRRGSADRTRRMDEQGERPGPYGGTAGSRPSRYDAVDGKDRSGGGAGRGSAANRPASFGDGKPASAGRTGRPNPAKSAAKSGTKSGKTERERERSQKDKGAPKWLKAKREGKPE